MKDIGCNKLSEYSNALDNLAKNKCTDIFPNKDRRHAAIAIDKILRYSKENIVIFDDNLQEYFMNNGQIDSFRSSVIDFVSRHGKIKILISNKDDNKELILFFDTLTELFPQQVFVKIITPEFMHSIKTIDNEKINFIVGDETKFRFEKNDIEDKIVEAKASFNNQKTSTKLLNVFSQSY